MQAYRNDTIVFIDSMRFRLRKFSLVALSLCIIHADDGPKSLGVAQIPESGKN
jgi:hypothetical protein